MGYMTRFNSLAQNIRWEHTDSTGGAMEEGFDIVSRMHGFDLAVCGFIIL